MGKILVTGGAGFIGSHVCKLLARAGREFIVYDNLDRGHREAVRWSELVQGDLNDTRLLTETIQRHQVDAVIHFAALAYVRESLEAPERYWRQNVAGTVSLLEAMIAGGARTMIFSSSCATYGIPPRVPIPVDTPQAPINPYGRTKLVGEWMIRDIAERHGLRTMFLRYFNVAGADPDGEIGEVHDPESHIIPVLLLKTLAGETEPARIFGREHPTPDGTCVRDYLHVVDLARAHLGALEYLERGGESTALNVGLGRGTSILELIRLCEQVTGRPVPHIFEPPYAGDPPMLVADPGDTWQRLGLQPNYPDVATMIDHAWGWFQHGRAAWLKSQ